MPIDLKRFSGFMNTDDSEYVVPSIHHLMAVNIRFRGTAGNLRAENIPGTTLIPNPGLPSGNNECIGAFYDPVRQRIFWFNFNDVGTHGIYIYNTQAQTVQTLLINGSATDGDILGFTLDQPIVSVGIIYGDPIDGDIIVFIDSLLRPTGFNVNRYLNTPYTVTKRSFIDIAKAPFRTVPQVTFENDTTVTNNGCKNSLYKIRARPVYDDFQKPVLSSGSICALPVNAANPIVDANLSKNARIAIWVPTGDVDVQKIEIWGTQITDTTVAPSTSSDSTSGDLGDYFLIISLDKSALSIPDNDTWRFFFYNDGTYTFGDAREENLLQDWCPQQANALELLNGDTIQFGGIKEGYDLVNGAVALTTNDTFQTSVAVHNGLLFFASQQGQTSNGGGNIIKVILEGAGINDVNGNPTILDNSYHVIFKVRVFDSLGIDRSFSHNNNLPVLTNIATILGDLGTAAVAQGFTVVSQIGNVLTLSYPFGDVVLHGANALGGTLPFADGIYYDILAYPHQAAVSLGIAYYDDKGRTNGVTVPITNSITTLEDATGTTIPQVIATISNVPPIWADYYHLVRYENTYLKHLFWACNQTFTITNLDNNVKYAYIGIGNMFDYNQNIQAATPVVSYGVPQFTPGDRIKFYVRYPVSLPQVTLPTYDYAIDSVEVDPVLNGLVQKGTFIKIVYPVNDINPNFDFTGDDFQVYKILIYNFAKRAASVSQQVYYEFGKQFAIGNAGLANRYHIGELQSQAPDYSIPAIVETADGDYFWRLRNVPAGAIYYIPGITGFFSQEYNTITTNPDNGGVSNGNYQISFQLQNTAFIGSGLYPRSIDDKYHFLNKLTTPQTIRLKGSYTAIGDVPLRNDLLVKIVNTDESVVIQYLVNNLFVAVPGGLQGSYFVEFDAYVSVPPGAKLWILAGNRSLSGVSNVSVGSFTVVTYIINNIQIPIIESSYSDKYNIVTNSNSRPTIYDPNARQAYYPVLLRWSLARQEGTNIDNINRYYFENQDSLDLNRADIRRIKCRDRIVRYFQDRGCCEKGVFNSYLQDSKGSDLLTTTNEIVSKNNVKYYEGEYGMGGQYTGLVSGKIQDYFPDVVRGYWMRLSGDGLIPVSELYKGEYYIRSLITPYNNVYTRPDGATARIIGYYDYLEEECHFLFQRGTNSALITIPSYNLSFNEKRNAFTGFYDAHPEWIISAEEDTYSWLNGQLYIHNNETNWCNFYGTQYFPSITLVFNDKAQLKKKFNAISYQSNNFWESFNVGDIQTSDFNPQTGLQQVSQLITQDQEINENVYYGALLRDSNSGLNPNIALLEGNFLLGAWLKTKLTYRGSNFVFLYSPYLSYIPSPRNF